MQMNNPIRGQKVTKTLVVEQKDTEQSSMLQFEVDMSKKYYNLKSLLRHHCSLKKHNIFIYNPSSLQFEEITKLELPEWRVPISVLEPSFILIRFNSKGTMDDEEDVEVFEEQEKEKISSAEKKVRSCERTIRDVIEFVKKWRDLHFHQNNIFRKKVSLHKAAKFVGISKKSLDDYYCQLRLGELYNFDFLNRLDEKMGILRNYNKSYMAQKEEDKKRKNRKHPKTLKIIDQYDIVSHHLKGEKLPANRIQIEDCEVDAFESSREASLNDQNIEQKVVGHYDNPLDGQGLFNEAKSQCSFAPNFFNLEDKFFEVFEPLNNRQNAQFFEINWDIEEDDFGFDDNGWHTL